MCLASQSSVSTLMQHCGQLRTISLHNCGSITDIDVSALVQSCGQQHSVDVNYCDRLIDIGASALGHGWSQQIVDFSFWLP
jgi:hypothetical protein